MERLSARQLLQSVTRLVEEPDIRALELSLIATLRNIVQAGSIRLCQLQPDPDDPRKRWLIYTDPFERVALESEPPFVECLRTQAKVVAPENGGVRVVHPIRVRNEVVGFLAMGCEREDAHDQEIVAILLDFFKNYASLLYDTERDVLTGLLNRKSFYEKVLQVIGAQREAQADGAAGRASCIAVIDIDHFKRVNDHYGHLVGDETLILFARAMIEAFRGGDLLFRMGGEEFVVVLRDVDRASALAVLERLRHAIEVRDFPQVGRLTTSIGASLVAASDMPMNIIDRADKALYYAKSNGRNRVCFFEDLIAEGKLDFAERQTDIELF